MGIDAKTLQIRAVQLTEPYRVCRRVNILRDYPDDKTKLYPEIRERAVQLLGCVDTFSLKIAK